MHGHSADSPRCPTPDPARDGAPPPAPEPQGHPGSAPVTLTGLAALLAGLPPSLGQVRVVAVDGHAGSGKSTFAAHLSEALVHVMADSRGEPGDGASGDPAPADAPDGAPVLHLDDLASHDALFGWTDRLREQVLVPLAQGRTARYPVYDWVRRRFGPRQGELPPAPVVLLDGVGAGRRALRPHLACLLWMDMPQPRARERGLRRDGPDLVDFWDGWTRAERTHFDEDPSSPYVNFLVSQGHEGYTVRDGPMRLT